MKYKEVIITVFLIAFVIIQNNAQEKEYKIAYQSIAWSPNGKQIFFTAIKVKPDWSDYSPDKWKLYMYNLNHRKLTEMGFSAIYFSFSPDGKTIAFDKNTSNNKGIFQRDLKFGEETTLVSDKSKDAGPSWSPDGKLIVFYSNRSGHEELYTLKINTKEINQITNSESYKCYNPIWSPNSNLIVYYLEKGDSKDQIWLTDSKGSFQKNLTNDDHHNIYPSWTPDGRILYVRDKGEVMVMNEDGSNKKMIIEGKGGLVRMDATGKKLLLTKGDGNLYVFYLKEKKLEKVMERKQLTQYSSNKSSTSN